MTDKEPMRSLACFLLFGLARVAFAADSDSCTPINSVPFTISQAGAYCLNKDIAATMAFGSAITIASSDVTLDLHGFRLGDEAAGLGTTANGIFAENRENITIRNGTIKGFSYGILFNRLTGGISRGHLVEKLRLEANTVGGVAIIGNGSVIRGNQIVKTGGSTASGANSPAFGIAIEGDGDHVIDNDIYETVGQGNLQGTAIDVDGSNAVIENNRISNSVLSTTVASLGISFDCCFNGELVLGNRISTMTFGIYFGTTTGKYRDNLLAGVTFPFNGGTNAGNNN